MRYGGLEVSRERVNDKVRLVLAGELDIAQIDRLKAELDRCSTDETLQLDTSELTFIDSTGLGAIVVARNRFGPDRFELVPSEAVQRVIELSGTADHLLG